MLIKILKLNHLRNLDRSRILLAVLSLAYALSFIILVNPVTTKAAVPKLINFQGKITAVSGGTNVANGTYAFRFKLYDALTAGNLLWTESFDQSVGGGNACDKLTVTNGVFNAKLGSCSSLAAVDFSGGSMYLSVDFAPTGTAYDGEMLPRKRLLSSAFAFVANSVSGDGAINTTHSSATALTIAKSGTDYALQVDTSAASAATGLKVTSAAAGSGLSLAAISSATNENLTLNAKGSGTISIGNSSTGNVLFGSAGQLSITSAGTVSTTGNISTTSSGTITSAGLLTGQAGLTVSGAAVSINNNSNFAVNIATGTTNTLTTIGGGSGTFSLQTSNIDISSAGAITNATGFNGLVVTANTGVITTGTWNGSVIGGTYGGTGVNNGNNTITLGGNINTAGAFSTSGVNSLTLTTTGATNVTLPTSGTLATLTGTENLTNKTLNNTNTVTLQDASFTLQDNSDNTKQAQFQLSGITSGQTRTYTLPDASGTICITGGTCVASAVPLSALTAAAGTNSINNGTHAQTWAWDSLAANIGMTLSSSAATTGSILKVQSTGSAALAGHKALEVTQSGANATGSQTTYGLYATNTRTGSGTNVGLYVSASGGSTNVAGRFDGGTSGTAIEITQVSTGTGVNVNTGITSGTGVNVFGGSLTSGNAIRISGTMGNTASSSNQLFIDTGRSATAATTDSSSFIKATRSQSINAASGTLAISGALIDFSSTCSATGGAACTDTSNILNVTQSYSSSSGAVINVSGAGTGNLLTADASNSSANGVLVDLQSSSTSQYVMNLTANNGSTNILYARADGNIGIGTTSPTGKVNILSTTEQLRLSYDANNYASFTMGASGQFTIGVTSSSTALLALPSRIQGGNSDQNWYLSSGLGSTTQTEYALGGSSTVHYRMLVGNGSSGTLTVNQNYAAMQVFGGKVTEAASGTHAIIAALEVKPPTITNGSATTTDAVTLHIDSAPSGGTNNYALWVDSGTTRLDGTLNLSSITGSTQCLNVDTNGNVSGTGSACGAGGGSQTPWTSDIDADGYALQDALNIEFRTAAGSAPVGSVVAVFADNSGDLTANVPTGKTFNVAVNGTDEYNFSATGLAMNANNITGVGTNITAASGLTLTSTSSDLNLSVVTSGGINLNPASTSAVTVNSGNQSGTFTSGFHVAANSLTSGHGLTASSSSLTSGSLVHIFVNSTGASSNSQKALQVWTTGANATSTQTTYGGYFNNTHSGTASTNVALYATATGGTNNYAGIFEEGNVGIGATSPTGKLHVISSGAQTTANTATIISNTSTSSTNSIDKIGLSVSSTGTWNGSSANNYALKVSPATGGTNNYNIYSGSVPTSNYWNGNPTDTVNFFSSIDSSSQYPKTVLAVNESTVADALQTAIYGNAIAKNTSGTVNRVYGVYGESIQEGSGNVNYLIGTSGYAEHDGAGTTTTMAALYAWPNWRSAGTVTNNYGLYIGDQSGVANTAVNNYQIYSATTDPFVVRADGFVGIGTNAPNQQLEITKNFRIAPSTATTGIIYTGANTLLHTFDGQGTSSNIYLGKSAGNLTATATSTKNVGIGVDALQSQTTGRFNTAVGNEALKLNATGLYNVGIGISALLNTTSSSNTAVGAFALEFNTSGAANSALGLEALVFNNTGSNNTAIGYQAGRGSFGSSNVSGNALFGYQAGYGLLTGGDGNILIGYQAGNNVTTGSKNIVIGYDIDAPSATSTQTLNIGNFLFGTGLDGTGTTLSNGKIGIGTSNPNSALEVYGNITLSSGQGQTITTAGTSLTIEQTGDTYGTSKLVLQNRNGSNGALFENVGLDLVDFAFKGNTGYQSNLRYEHRSGSIQGGSNTALGEFQFIDDATGTASFILTTNKSATVVHQGTLAVGAATSLVGKLHVAGTVTTSGADAVAGIYTNLTMSNSTASGFQFGNRSLNTVSSTVAGTHVGQFIRMTDSTSLSTGQVVRGMEIQAYSGTNNNGINTGLAAFAKTFGVHAETTAQAGVVSQPAAVFADLNNSSNTTVGNAIRAYTNDATTADLVSFYQETSAFSGNGLIMNFGNNSGSFTGNFISLQKAGTQNFHVDDDGSTFVSLTGTQTTVALCHATNGQTNDDEIVDCSGAPSDVAEYFGSRDATLAPAEIVVMAEDAEQIHLDGFHTSKAWVARSSKPYEGKLLGIVSTAPAAVYGDEIFSAGENPRPVALAGRVPVKVTLENGPITAGDFITSSSTPGVGMKATKAGPVVGQALESFDGTGEGTIIVFVKASTYNGVAINNQLAGLEFGYSNNEVAAQTSAEILTGLLEDLSGLDSDNLSQVNTDLVIAGAEVIAPNVTASGLRVDTIMAATATGGLEVASSTIFNGGLRVDSLSSITGLLSFNDDVEFFGTPYFTSDTAGFAVIEQGAQSVTVEFSREYLAQPIVNASISFEQGIDLSTVSDDTRQALEDSAVSQAQSFLSSGISYVVTNKSAYGFTIVLNKPAQEDIKFSWVALAVRNAATFMSKYTGGVAGVMDIQDSASQIIVGNEHGIIFENSASDSNDSTSSDAPVSPSYDVAGESPVSSSGGTEHASLLMNSND